MKKAAVYCMTRNMYDITAASIKSLLINSDVDVIYLLIEDDEYPIDLPKIKVINVSGQQYFNSANGNCRWTYMTLMRTALAKILKESRVLSLDCDTIIDGDISGLWELPIKDYYLAAGMEPHKSQGRIYVNTGVALFNLSKIRKDGVADKMIEALNKKPYAFPDQDVVNEFCAGKIYVMPPEYNVHYWSVKTDKQPVIIHYAGHKDWRQFELYKKYANIEVEK